MVVNKVKSIYLICLGFVFIFMSCNEKKDNIYFNNLHSSYNLLNISHTDFVYENMDIYSLGIIAKTSIPTYLYNFFIVENDTLKFINLTKYCELKYCINSYSILRDFKDISKTDSYDQCDPYLLSFLPLNLNRGDTIYYFLNKTHNEKTNTWITLERKFYDKGINDTIYKYNFHNRPKTYKYYYFTKQIGFIGITTFFEGYIEDTIGYPFNSKSSLIELITIDHQVLSCISNVSKR